MNGYLFITRLRSIYSVAGSKTEEGKSSLKIGLKTVKDIILLYSVADFLYVLTNLIGIIVFSISTFYKLNPDHGIDLIWKSDIYSDNFWLIAQLHHLRLLSIETGRVGFGVDTTFRQTRSLAEVPLSTTSLVLTTRYFSPLFRENNSYSLISMSNVFQITLPSNSLGSIMFYFAAGDVDEMIPFLETRCCPSE